MASSAAVRWVAAGAMALSASACGVAPKAGEPTWGAEPAAAREGAKGEGAKAEGLAPLGVVRLALDADCEKLGVSIVGHSCLHAEAGPFEAVVAETTLDFAGRNPNIDVLHTHYTVALPEESPGVVKYRPLRSGDWAFQLAGPVEFQLLDEAGSPLTRLLRHGETGCPLLEDVHLYELEALETYRLVFPPGAGEAAMVVEYLPDFQQLMVRDADGDGVGAEAEAADFRSSACEPAAGWVPYGTGAGGEDCDDTDPGRYPGAAERCDGLDNDCDGQVDEELGEACGAAPAGERAERAPGGLRGKSGNGGTEELPLRENAPGSAKTAQTRSETDSLLGAGEDPAPVASRDSNVGSGGSRAQGGCSVTPARSSGSRALAALLAGVAVTLRRRRRRAEAAACGGAMALLLCACSDTLTVEQPRLSAGGAPSDAAPASGSSAAQRPPGPSTDGPRATGRGGQPARAEDSSPRSGQPEASDEGPLQQPEPEVRAEGTADAGVGRAPDAGGLGQGERQRDAGLSGADASGVDASGVDASGVDARGADAETRLPSYTLGHADLTFEVVAEAGPARFIGYLHLHGAPRAIVDGIEAVDGAKYDFAEIQIVSRAVFTPPPLEAFAPLCTPFGEPVHLLPQSLGGAAGAQAQRAPFVGVELKDPGLLADGFARLSLVAVEGPGQHMMWKSALPPWFGFSSCGGVDTPAAAGLFVGHDHWNLGFTRPGKYAVTYSVAGTLAADGSPVTGRFTVHYLMVEDSDR